MRSCSETLSFAIDLVSLISVILRLPVTPDIQSSAEKYMFAERRRVVIFQPNWFVDVSYECPILEQLLGECCPIAQTKQ